jgi:ketosteroid isomerase-like protein
MADVVAMYFRAMAVHDWATLRSCLTDDFTRVGPYEEHDFRDPESYVRFLADVLPALVSHEVDLTRITHADDVAYVDLTETIYVAGAATAVRVCCAFELAPDHRIRHIEVFVRRPPLRAGADQETS